MSRNIEIKACITHTDTLLPQVRIIADEGPFEVQQDDTYFVCSAGKLKLRAFSENEGRTRIHLDDVSGLGHFLELEVVLAEDEAPDVGIQEANQLLAHLAIAQSQLVSGGYLDLLARGES